MMKCLFRFAFLAVLACLSSCVTPSVPIPPPEPERMVFAVDVDAGLVTFAYEPHPVNAGAVVYVFNRTQGVGVITVAEENGQVNPTAPFPGAEGNQVVITFELDDQRAATCVEIHDGPSSSAYECLP